MSIDEIVKTELRGFINADLKLTSFPSKLKKELIFTYFVATKFEKGKIYNEMEVNKIIFNWMTFKDSTIRRDLVDTNLLTRTDDGKQYWINDIPEFEEFINKNI